MTGAPALRCFSRRSLSAIIAGLDNPSVSRLKKTWKLVPKDTKVFQDLYDIILPTNAYKLLREKQRSAGAPVIPYIAVHIVDLEHLNQAATYLDTKEDTEMVNFSKFRVQASIFAEIAKFRATRYILETVPKYQAWLAANIGGLEEEEKRNDKEFYRHSLQIEPSAIVTTSGMLDVRSFSS